MPARALQSGSVFAGNSGIDIVSGTIVSADSLQMLSDAKGGLGGGDAYGGAVQLFVGGQGAQANIANAPVNGPTIGSRAIGGDATEIGQSGGVASSGFTGITLANGGTVNLLLDAAGPLRLESSAFGGNAFGEGGSGGDANLASMNIFSFGGSPNGTMNLGALEMVQTARGVGAFGTSLGSSGGAAYSTQQVFELVNMSFSAASIDAEMSLTGGNGINGGEADRTGTVFMRANASTATVSGSTRFTSIVTGGNGRNGGAGGDAYNGAFFIDAVNGSAPSLIDLQDLQIDFRATGGDGGTDTMGGSGGAGGAGGGNPILIFGNAVNGTLVVNGNALITSQGTGGLGGDGFNGGTGGDGRGGVLQFGTCPPSAFNRQIGCIK